MRKLKITFLILYIMAIIALLYEAIIPGNVSAKQHAFFKKMINNISKMFIRTKIIKPEDIYITTEFKETYYTNETLTINAYVTPSNASYKELEFSSSNTDVLTIDGSGNVTFLSEGTSTITIKQKESNIIKEIDINVLEYILPIDDIIEPNSITLKSYDDKNKIEVGDIILFYLEYDRKDVNDHKFYLESSNPEVCECFDSYAYGLKPGDVTITVTHRTTGLKDSMNITITDGMIVEPEYYRIIGDDTIYVNDTKTHTYKLEIDPNASNMYKEAIFIAYDEFKENSPNKILDIGWKTGKLSFNGYGEGYIVVVSANWRYYDYIKVSVKNVLPDFNVSSKRIILGKSYKVELDILNKEEITYDIFTYESSDESIASVDNLGNITPHKEGEVLIKVSVDDNYDKVEKVFKVLVEKKVIEDDIGSSFSKIIRKGIAHFLGFIVFGFIAFIMFYLWITPTYNNKKLIYLLIGINGLIFAILTEFIQLFSPGRDGKIADVILDYVGYTISFIISLLILLIYLHFKRQKKDDNLTNDINSN